MAMYWKVILFNCQIFEQETIDEIDAWCVEREIPEYESFKEFDFGWCNNIRRYSEHREEFLSFLKTLKDKHQILDFQIAEKYEDSQTWGMKNL